MTIKRAALKGLRANNTRNTLKVASYNYKIISILDYYLVAIKETRNRPAAYIC